jgi:4-amino-4-deoxy-L-arabinose transferase-like glycosyltransferase
VNKILSWLTSSPAIIFAVALALRVAFILVEGHKVPPQALATIPFENEVGNIANALANGHGFCCLFRQPTGPTAWLAPIYPLLVVLIFKIFGSFTVRAFYAAALTNAAFSAVATFPIFYSAKRIAGSPIAALSAWLWALLPAGILMPFEWIWDTSLSALLAATIFWSTLELERSRSRASTIAYGILWGIALLTNPALGVLLPFLLAWLAYRWRPQNTQSLRRIVFLIAIAFVMCVPWSLRNFAQFHRLIPIRSNFAFELWLGNNEIFDEHSRELNRITRFEQVRLYAQLGETAFLDQKRQQAETFIKQHPGLALHLAEERFISTWFGTATPLDDFRHADSALVKFLFLWNAFTFAAIFVGLVRLAHERNPYLAPIAVFPLIFPVVYYITHTSQRYRHPMDPILVILIAVAILGARTTHTSADNANQLA